MRRRSIKRASESKLNSEEFGLELRLASGRSDDHTEYDLLHNGVLLTQYKISHTSHEFGTRLMGNMAKQLGISISQLRGINACPFGPKDFVEKSRLINQ